jgi:hypothetical protein
MIYCFLRLIRNLVIAIASAIWLIPLWFYSDTWLRWMATLDGRLPEGSDTPVNFLPWPGLSSVSHFAVCESALMDLVTMLGIVIIFWAFVAANRLWPIKKVTKQS